ncbi:hypothetical protein NG99_09405 [Erwinia typographi]|uniref:Uncharacterized protein n=1 Tax=Erwinia typographi TaxID=371042 RepID=A0A0A3Z9A5_9GAMM|nr:hypothetical protein NG99_09405 [Erwinia typographi]
MTFSLFSFFINYCVGATHTPGLQILLSMDVIAMRMLFIIIPSEVIFVNFLFMLLWKGDNK